MSPEVTKVMMHSGVVVALMMVIVWLISLKIRNASIVDLAWGMGFVLIAWTAVFCRDKLTFSVLWLPILVTAWGIRLGGYLAWRNLGKDEDYRYQAMRQKWGKKFPWVSLLTVFALQGIVMWLVALPIQHGIASGLEVPEPLSVAYIGTVIWAIGFLFEAIGDWQLSRFIANRSNETALLDTGLWRYTRHPNYFGDFLVWWGFFIVAISFGAAWWTCIGPLIMSLFLLHISGVSLLEKNLLTKKPSYAEYVERTNAFFPWLPRE